MVLGAEEVAVAIHGDLQAGVAGEGLDGFRRQPRVDPAGDREVAQRVPVKRCDVGFREQRLEAALDHVGVAFVVAPAVRKDQIIIAAEA